VTNSVEPTDSSRGLRREAHPSMLKSHPRAATIAVALVLLSVLAILLSLHPARTFVQGTDEAVLRFMRRIRWTPLTWLGYVLNVIGSVVVTLPVRIGASLWLAYKRRWWFFATFVLTWALSEIASTMIKHAVDRPRPPGSLVHTTGASFPSGHAVATAATAVSLAIVLLPPGPKRRRWEIAGIAFTLLMGLSRAYLAAHWLSDAIAGVIIGWAIAVSSAVIVQWIHDRVARRALERAQQEPGAIARIPEPGPLETSAVVDALEEEVPGSSDSKPKLPPPDP